MAKKIHSYEISKADLKVAKKNQLNDLTKINLGKVQLSNVKIGIWDLSKLNK